MCVCWEGGMVGMGGGGGVCACVCVHACACMCVYDVSGNGMASNGCKCEPFKLQCGPL